MADIQQQQENLEKKVIRRKQKCLKLFTKTFFEFISDVKKTYPEYVELLESNYQLDKEDEDSMKLLLEGFVNNIKPYLLEISEKNDSVFLGDSPIVIFKDLDLKELWSKSSNSNKSVIWKYLHTLIIIGNNYSNTRDKLFENFNQLLQENSYQEDGEINDQSKAMLNMVSSLSQSIKDMDEQIKQKAENGEELPDISPENLLGNGLFEGSKIGQIAKDLASELNFEEFFDFKKEDGEKGENKEESNNKDFDPSKLFDSILGKDPSKLMGLIQNVGNKIQNQIQSGQINEQDLVNEAQNMMGNLQNNPLFKNLSQNMGNGGGGGVGGNPMAGLFGMLNNPAMQNMFSGGNGDNEDELDDLDLDLKKDESNESSGLNMNPNLIQNMASQMSKHMNKPQIDKSKLKQMQEREKMKQKLQKRREQQQQNLYNSNTQSNHENSNNKPMSDEELIKLFNQK